jgi:hypothetical protein
VIHFEQFFSKLANSYNSLREFLGIDAEISAVTRCLLEGRAINHRKLKAVGPVETWSAAKKERFMLIAGDVMAELGYECL